MTHATARPSRSAIPPVTRWVAAALTALLIAALLHPSLARAETLLTVVHDGEETAYDRAALDALPQTGFETSTIWTDGLQAFGGVEVATLLDTLEVEEGTLQLTAANDYSITIPVSEIRHGGALVATTRNGAPMRLRDKGPLWLVYPYDSSEDFRSEVIYSNSIWQLVRITVQP